MLGGGGAICIHMVFPRRARTRYSRSFVANVSKNNDTDDIVLCSARLCSYERRYQASRPTMPSRFGESWLLVRRYGAVG